MSTYYFPINSSSLAHYFGGACIKAAKYFNNKPQDIQDRYNEFLLLTDKKEPVQLIVVWSWSYQKKKSTT